MEDEKTFLIDFIEVYKSLPSLWKIKSKDYSNRVIKNRDYNILIEKLKERYPEATKEMAIKKINVLRTSYRRELKKKKASFKSGAGADDEYVPALWYFDLLTFLDDQEDCVRGRSSMDDIESEEFETPPKKKKVCPEDNLIKLACEKLSSSNSQPKEYDSVAISWANQCAEMDENQKIISRKIISDVLFHGCLGNLQISHTIDIQNVLNNKLVPEYRSNLDQPIPANILKVPTPLSSGDSTSFGASTYTNDTPIRQNTPNVVYFVQNENDQNSINDSYIIEDEPPYRKAGIRKFFSTFEESDE